MQGLEYRNTYIAAERRQRSQTLAQLQSSPHFTLFHTLALSLFHFCCFLPLKHFYISHLYLTASHSFLLMFNHSGEVFTIIVMQAKKVHDKYHLCSRLISDGWMNI